MKYLKIKPNDLSHIDLKTFQYPSITYYKGTYYKGLDRDGWDSVRNILEAWMHVPYGEQKITLYWKESHSDFDEVRKEVELWNSDPKRYWTEELIRSSEEKCISIEAEIENRKKDLKRLKKMQKKLGKDS